jgi:WD40 repeat protein
VPDGKRLISHGSTWRTSGASLAAAEALVGDETQRIGGISVSGSIQVSAGTQPDSEGIPVGGIDHPVMDNSIRVWDVSTGQMLTILEPRADELFEALAVDPNGELLAVAVDGPEPVIRLWSFADKQVVTTLYRRDFGLSDMTFSPDGILLAASDRNGIVWVWEVPAHTPPP